MARSGGVCCLIDWLAMNQTLLEKERGRVRALGSQVEELRAAKDQAEQQVLLGQAGRQTSAKCLAGWWARGFPVDGSSALPVVHVCCMMGHGWMDGWC